MKLLPCPWCGLIPEVIKFGIKRYRVQCDVRDCEVEPRGRWRVSKKLAVECWNRRAKEGK